YDNSNDTLLWLNFAINPRITCVTLHSHLYCMVFGASVKNTNKTTWVKVAYMGHREKQYLYILWAMATPIDLDFAFAVAVGSFVWPLGRGFQTVSFC
uniref:Uncharacterized protein n=1 Tax=Sinocyclocheilus grahami TaxID=75366 RepID=A0A672S822_SINGR